MLFASMLPVIFLCHQETVLQHEHVSVSILEHPKTKSRVIDIWLRSLLRRSEKLFQTAQFGGWEVSHHAFEYTSHIARHALVCIKHCIHGALGLNAD